MKNRFRAFFLLFFACFILNAQNDTCRFFINLNKIVNYNKLEVVFVPPAIKKDTVVYRMPAIVPGTYEILNFGRFISSFKAIAKDGSYLKVDSLDMNSYKIKNAKQLDRIVYWVEDTWHTPKKENFVFEPAGTNIEPGSNFVINPYGFCGYIDGYRNSPISLSINHPENFYGSTCLDDNDASAVNDIFITPDYVRLADSPIMYCVPDTTTLTIGGATVLVSVYSQSKKVQSKFIADKIKDVLEAQKNYLGGKLPVKKYAFIIYISKNNFRSGSTGALEHSYSSFYCFEDLSLDELVRELRDVTSHEFFHIITPLGVHSEEIGDFDFAAPLMSKHLWLYEGVTEYFAGHVQVRYGLLTEEEYLTVLKNKIMEADNYNDTVPFTTMSRFCLGRYKDEYMNVYEKGALIGMCLDIKLLSLSGGYYGLNNLLIDLFKKYGPEKSFKDEELIDTIVMMTHPAMRDFFTRYIEGAESLPLNEIFALAGINYEKQNDITIGHTLAGAKIGYNAANNKFEIKMLTRRAKKSGLKVNDALLSIDNTIVTNENVVSLIERYGGIDSLPNKVQVIVLRKVRGKAKEINLKVEVAKIAQEKSYRLTYNEYANEQQLALRKTWLKGIVKKPDE